MCIRDSYQRLSVLDRAAADRIHPHNTKRVIRALEIAMSGNNLEDFKKCTQKCKDYDINFIILTRNRPEDVYKRQAQARLCCPTIDQVGAAALYNHDPSYFDDIKKEYEHRRDVSVEALNEIEGIKYGIPEGAFYITAQLPVDDAEKFLMFLLTEFDVNGETCMFAPAGGFFSTKGVGQSDMRIAYVLNAEDMKAGINIIKEGIKAYNNR